MSAQVALQQQRAAIPAPPAAARGALPYAGMGNAQIAALALANSAPNQTLPAQTCTPREDEGLVESFLADNGKAILEGGFDESKDQIQDAGRQFLHAKSVADLAKQAAATTSTSTATGAATGVAKGTATAGASAAKTAGLSMSDRLASAKGNAKIAGGLEAALAAGQSIWDNAGKVNQEGFDATDATADVVMDTATAGAGAALAAAVGTMICPGFGTVAGPLLAAALAPAISKGTSWLAEKTGFADGSRKVISGVLDGIGGEETLKSGWKMLSDGRSAVESWLPGANRCPTPEQEALKACVAQPVCAPAPELEPGPVCQVPAQPAWQAPPIYGPPDLRTSDVPNLGTCELPDLRTSDVPNLGTCELPDLSTCELPDLGTCELPDLGTCELPDLGTCELPDLRTSEAPNLGTCDLPNLGTCEAPDLRTSEVPNLGTCELPNLGTCAPPPVAAKTLPRRRSAPRAPRPASAPRAAKAPVTAPVASVAPLAPVIHSAPASAPARLPEAFAAEVAGSPTPGRTAPVSALASAAADLPPALTATPVPAPKAANQATALPPAATRALNRLAAARAGGPL